MVSDTLFCENDATAIEGPWDDGGGNTVTDECPVDCPGDIDGDLVVDVADFSEFLIQFGETGPGLSADIDGDQDVDIDDFSDFLVNFGNVCTAPLRAAPVKSKSTKSPRTPSSVPVR